jgi:Sulfotransferase family
MLYIFMHIPKTAGTSLWEILKQQYQEDEILALYDLNPYLVDKNSYILKNLLNEHPKTKVIIGHFMYGIHKNLKNVRYKYITFLRDPIARCLSQYIHHYSENLFNYEDESTNLMLEKDDICEYLLLDEVKLFYPDLQVRYLGGYADKNLSVISSEEIIKTCLNNVKKDFLFVGHQENFNQDILALSYLLNWKNFTYKNQIPNSNTRNRLDPCNIFNKKELQQLHHANKLDFLFFNAYNDFHSHDYHPKIKPLKYIIQCLRLKCKSLILTCHKKEYNPYKKSLFISSLKLLAIKNLRQSIIGLDEYTREAQNIMDYQQEIIKNQQLEIEKLKSQMTNTYEI